MLPPALPNPPAGAAPAGVSPVTAPKPDAEPNFGAAVDPPPRLLPNELPPPLLALKANGVLPAVPVGAVEPHPVLPPVGANEVVGEGAGLLAVAGGENKEGAFFSVPAAPNKELPVAPLLLLPPHALEAAVKDALVLAAAAAGAAGDPTCFWKAPGVAENSGFAGAPSTPPAAPVLAAC